MKTSHKILLGFLVAFAGLAGLSSCATDGYVSASTGVYYGGPIYHDPWFHDDSWTYGHNWYGEHPEGHTDVYIHPPRVGHSEHSDDRHR
jgi:hypothetical protein